MFNTNTILCPGRFKVKEISNTAVEGQSFPHKGLGDHMSSKKYIVLLFLWRSFLWFIFFPSFIICSICGINWTIAFNMI